MAVTEEIIEGELRRYVRWVAGRSAAAALGQIHRDAENIAREELANPLDDPLVGLAIGLRDGVRFPLPIDPEVGAVHAHDDRPRLARETRRLLEILRAHVHARDPTPFGRRCERTARSSSPPDAHAGSPGIERRCRMA